MGNLGDYVLALKPTDDFLHVGLRDVLLGHLDVTTVGTVPPAVADVQFYADDGAVLTIGEAGGVPALVSDPLGMTADTATLVDRTTLVLARAQVVLATDPNDAVGTRLPVVQAELPVVLAALAEAFGVLTAPVFEPSTNGGQEGEGGENPVAQPHFTNSPLHNFFHAIGLA